MTVRKLLDSGDIATSGSQFVSGASEVAQTIKTRLQLFLGEYFRDVAEGTDWFGRILGKNVGLGRAEAEIKRRIAQTPDVRAITGFQFDFDTASRTATVTCSVATPYGEASVTVGSIV